MTQEAEIRSTTDLYGNPIYVQEAPEEVPEIELTGTIVDSTPQDSDDSVDGDSKADAEEEESLFDRLVLKIGDVKEFGVISEAARPLCTRLAKATTLFDLARVPETDDLGETLSLCTPVTNIMAAMYREHLAVQNARPHTNSLVVDRVASIPEEFVDEDFI